MKPQQISVTMRLSTAIIHWQVMETFATMPGLPPMGRQRAHELAEQYAGLSRGDIPNGQALSESQDALTAYVLDEHEPRTGARRLSYTVEFWDKTGHLLADGLPQSYNTFTPWEILKMAAHQGRELPAGLVSWLREATSGDRANFYNSETGLRVHAEVRAAPDKVAND